MNTLVGALITLALILTGQADDGIIWEQPPPE
jgi:hypothetical protein